MPCTQRHSSTQQQDNKQQRRIFKSSLVPFRLWSAASPSIGCGNKVRAAMISRRDKLLNHPFEVQRYEQHKQKVRSAKPAIDVRTPAIYPHVIIKPKKVQSEKERLRRIEAENMRLLQKLGNIMQTKRMQNIWIEPRPNYVGREKLFETRPHSTLPKLISAYAPSSITMQKIMPKSATIIPLKSPNAKTTQRCLTCIGKPECTILNIPEKRIPWALPRKSWNAKVHDFCPKRCIHCGHPRRQ